VGNLHDGREKEARLLDLVLAGQVDGVLLLNGHVLKTATRSLADTTVPIVAISVPTAIPGVPAVLVRDREGAAAVARHLLELGHRRFGYVSGPAGNYVETERWAGFENALAAAGIPGEAVTRYPGDFHVRSGVAAGRRFLAEAERPTAVFAVSDMMAVGFMRTVHAAGLAVPNDVSVVGYDGIEFADYCEPPLTTVRQPREVMGREAAELLIRMIRGEPTSEDGPIRRLEVSLRCAGSTAPPADGTQA
jgi:LacI family repressor for deo operon, udp, cdd, tsx, nupC, and nupG